MTNALGGTKTFDYDESGNLISETDFGGNATTYSYDAAGRKISVTSPLDDERTGLTKTYFDPNGNVIKTAVKSNKKGVDETFDITDYSYDCMNNVTSSAVHPTADSTIYTQYEYDSLGNLTRQITGLTELLDDTSVIPEGVSCISNSYDELGRLKRKSDEPTATNFNSNLYIRNRVGNVLIERTPNGNLIQYKYDDFDNLLKVKNGDNVFVENTYDINGKRKTMTDETGTTNYTHNAFGELTTEEKNGTIKTYTYDLAGRRTGFTLSAGGRVLKSITYNYDALGRMTSVSDGTETTEYAYDENSNLVSRSRGGTVYQTNEYNKASLPERMIFNNSDGTQDIHRYVYSANGNVAAYNSSAIGTHIYEYDLCGRLQKDRFLDSGANRYLDTYVYDSRGNIEQYKHNYYTESGEIIDEMTYSYDISNRMVSGTNGSDSFTYEYDDNGNMLSVSKNGVKTREFVYNKINNLVSSTVDGVMTEYTYNGDRLRETKTTKGITTRHIYDGTDVVADVTGDTTTNFVRGIGLIYSENMTTGEKRRYDLNAHGDVVKRKNADGTAENFNYRAYGKAAAATPDPFGYCGEYTDSETGLIYLRNRYYDPELGRFINADPVFSGANWYAYCSGNPVRYVDPDGLNAIIVTNKNSVQLPVLGAQGHTSALYQDSNGEWFYSYWGNKAAAVIHIPHTYIKQSSRDGNVVANSMDSLQDFNNSLNIILKTYGFSNITSDYTDATYVVGDFTASLSTAYADVKKAATNFVGQESGLTQLDDGTLVFQGFNRSYGALDFNCFDKTYASLSKGTLADGTNVGDYMSKLGFDGGVIPNKATPKFIQTFMNNSFTFAGAKLGLKNYSDLYLQNSPWAQKWEKFKYSSAAIGR